MELSENQKAKIKKYYRRSDVEQEIVNIAEHREIAPTHDWGYGSRPDTINFPGDFRSFVDNGAISFHGSVEKWRNPLLIDEVDSEDLRTGWDLVIDIDCDEDGEDLAMSKATVNAVIKKFESLGVRNYSIKFSGNRGFHIGVRAEAFPEKIRGKHFSQWYPELPQAIVGFLRDELEEELVEVISNLRPELKSEIIEIEKLEMGGGGDWSELEIDVSNLPYKISDIENDWGNRHLFRLPYSVHDGSGLVSVPLKKSELWDFRKEDAAIDNIEVKNSFLEEYEKDEAEKLVDKALSWWDSNKSDSQKKKRSEDREFTRPDEALPEDTFPPTIHNILDGLEDGRKRALFVLVTFLQQVGYDMDAVEQAVHAWNGRNDEPLRDRYVDSQLSWHRRQDEPLMPPNWDENSVYHAIGVYEEDPLTRNTNNPVSYAFAKASDNEADAEGSEDDGGKPVVECPYCGKEYQGETKWYKDHVRACQG